MTTYKTVPVEPTDAMLDRAVAFALQVSLGGNYGWTDYMRDLWARFLSAVPNDPGIPASSAPDPSGEAVSIRDFQIRCHADRDISNALAEAMLRLPACQLHALVSGALQEIEALRHQVAHPPAERDAEDGARLDWLEQAATVRKVELAKSLYGTGFEIGEWPSMRVTVRKGSLRDAIDAARGAE